MRGKGERHCISIKGEGASAGITGSGSICILRSFGYGHGWAYFVFGIWCMPWEFLGWKRLDSIGMQLASMFLSALDICIWKGRLELPSEPGARSPDGGECRTIGSRRGLGPARDVAVAKVVEGRHAIGCHVTCSNRPPLKCIVQPLQSSDGMFVSRKDSRRGRETRSGRPQVVSLKSRLLENEAACLLVPRGNEGGRLTEKIREEKKMEDEARVVFWSGVVLQWSMHLAGCSG